jgi:hypothetical protein
MTTLNNFQVVFFFLQFSAESAQGIQQNQGFSKFWQNLGIQQNHFVRFLKHCSAVEGSLEIVNCLR